MEKVKRSLRKTECEGNEAGPSIVSDGMKRAQYNKALRNHRIRFEDAVNPKAERVKEINENDILFGRGRGLQRYPGNLRMREIIDKHKSIYHTLTKAQKRKFAESIYDDLVAGGARFLKRATGGSEWVIVDVFVAQQKVLNTLRCTRNFDKKQAGKTGNEKPLTTPSFSVDGHLVGETPLHSQLAQSGTAYVAASTGDNSLASTLDPILAVNAILDTLAGQPSSVLGREVSSGFNGHLGIGPLHHRLFPDAAAFSFGTMQSPDLLLQLEARRLAGFGGHHEAIRTSLPPGVGPGISSTAVQFPRNNVGQPDLLGQQHVIQAMAILQHMTDANLFIPTIRGRPNG
jgi:hypothetical protein